MAGKELRGQESIIVRHADKGVWKIDIEALKTQLPPEQANLIMAVLQNEFPKMMEKGETPLKLEGLERSFRLAESLFAKLPDNCILITIDSGKDRAQLCRHLVTARLGQLERQYNKEHKGASEKNIDMLEVDEADLIKLLADSHPDTWDPYAEMMKVQGINEEEALFRWLNDMNAPDAEVSPEKSPKESADRYRLLVQLIHSRILQSDNSDSERRQSPVVMFAAGHSGALVQALYEDQSGNINPEDVPAFCEQFRFDKTGKIVDTERVDL